VATLSVVGNSDLGNSALAGYFTATTSTASSFPYASTTMITATTASSTNLFLSSLGLNQIPYATTAGQLTGSSNLTFNGTTLTANALSLTGITGSSQCLQADTNARSRDGCRLRLGRW